MPIHSYSTAADWDAAYGPVNSSRVPALTQWTTNAIGHRTPVRIRFSDDPILWQKCFYGHADSPEWWERRRDGILAFFAIQQTDRILVVGAGTGALVWAFRDAGYAEAYGLEDSPFIHGAGQTARIWPGVTLVNENIAGNRLTQALRRDTGATDFAWIIDEDAMVGYTDAELNEIRVNPDVRFIDLPELILESGRPQSNIIHIVGGGSAGFVNVKTLAEWQQVDPAHSWIGGL